MSIFVLTRYLRSRDIGQNGRSDHVRRNDGDDQVVDPWLVPPQNPNARGDEDVDDAVGEDGEVGFRPEPPFAALDHFTEKEAGKREVQGRVMRRVLHISSKCRDGGTHNYGGDDQRETSLLIRQ